MGNSKSKWRFHSSKDTCTYPIKYGVEEQSDISEEHLSNAEHNDVHKCVTAINIGTIHGGTVHINCYDDTRTKHRFNSNLVNSVERRKSKIIKCRGNKYEGKQLNKVPRFKQKLKQLFGRCHCESASDLPPGSKTRGLAHISQPVNSDSESAQQFIHVDSTPDDHSTEPDLYEALYVRENADDVVRASERQQCKQVTSNDACSASHSLISVEKESADTSIIGTQESDLSIRENTHLKTGTVDSTLNSNESYISVKDNISNMQYKIYEHFKSKHYRQAERTPTFLHSLPANTCKKEKHIQSERNDGNNLRQNCSVSNNSEVRCDVSTYRKHNEDSKQYSKLCQNTSVFSESSDEHTEIETSFPQLDLQCDCNSFLEFSALKLPDPFYTTEETEEKHSNFEWTSQTDTVPTGYPWNTGSSEGPHFCTDGFISSDLTESTEEISSKFQTNYGLDVYRKYLEMEMISTGLEDIHVEGSTALCWEQSKNDITGHTVNTTNVEERHSEIGEPEYIQTEQHHVLDCVSTRTEAVKNGEESESEANKGGMDNFMPASPYRNSPISENIDSGVFTLHSKDRETMVRCRENQVVQTNLPNSCCDSKFTRTCIEDRALLIEQVHVQLLWEFLGSDHTPTCFNVLAILHSDKSADNALWIIKVSEEGIMQEVDLFSELQNDRELITVDAEMTESRFKLIEDTSERASVIRDEAIILNSKITDDGSDIDQLNETSNGELTTISYKYDSLFVSDSKQEMGVRQGLPVKTVRSLSESNCVDIDLMQVENKFSIKQELSTDACKFHSLPSIAAGRKCRIIHTANATYGSKALSESDLQEIKCVHQHVVFYQHINPEVPLFTMYDDVVQWKTLSNAVTLPQSRTLPDHASDNADAGDERVSDHSRRFSKTVSPGMEINENAVDFSNKEERELTIKRSKKGRKKLVAKKKRSTKASVPKSENKLSFQYSSDFSSRLHEKKRLKRNIIIKKTHQMHQLKDDSDHRNGSNKSIDSCVVTCSYSYGRKALSESDLQETECVNHQHRFKHTVLYQHINPEEPLSTRGRYESTMYEYVVQWKTLSNAVTLPQSRTLPLPDHASDNADAGDERESDHSRRFSKTVSPGMEINEIAVDFSNKEEKELTTKKSKKGRKKMVVKKKRTAKTSVPKSENKLSFQYSSDISSRLHEKKRLKRNIVHNKTHQMHQLEYDSHHQNGSNKLIKLFGDISCDNHDSGIGTLTNSMSISSLSMVIGSSSPTGWLLDDYLELDADNSDNRIAMQYLKGKHTRKERNVKMFSCIVKKKFVIKQHRKYFKKFFTACQRQLKSVVRELHVEHRYIVFGIGSYFDRLNNGPPPTIRERMQYEWIRLGTFHNYTGSGNGLALARNGFYHEHTEGSSSTSCFLCDARHSTWEMFDDISAEHRRQSPNCPMHENREESVNVSITHDDSSAASSRASASRATSRNVSSTAQSSSSSSSGPKFDSAGSSLSSSSSTVPAGSASSTSAGAVREVSRSLQETHISEVQASRIGGESIPQQPTDDPESRDRSMLALSQPHMQRALGRTGLAYSNIVPPQRNNIATGAASNVGLGPSGSDPLSTASQPSDIRLSSILGGPVGAGAFSGLNTTAQTRTSSKSTASQHNNAATATSSSNARQTNPAPGTGGRTDPTSVVLIDNPKHPDYIHVDVRVSSFQAWPDHLDQTPRQMAEAGFFFVGVADFSRCFCCGGGLRNWEPGDDPMLEHTRWFPRCEYVKKLKGERYVAAVQRRHHEHMAEQQRQQIELAQTRDDNRIPPDPMTTDAAAVMREMGYSIDRTREAILAVRQQTGSTRVTTQQVLTWLLDDEDRRTSHTTELGVRSPASTVSSTHTPTVSTSSPSTLINTGTTVASSIVNTGTSIATSSVPTATSIVIADTTPSTISSTPAINTAEIQQSGTPNSSSSSESGSQQTGTENSSSSSSGSYTTMVEKQSPSSRGDRDEAQSTVAEDTTGREPTNKTAKKKKAKKKTKTGARGGSLDAKSLMAENEKLREMQTCKICMEQVVNTTLLPCGHLVCCDMCASRLQRCPICRKRIKGTIKTFMS